jgi:hypothetical protein
MMSELALFPTTKKRVKHEVVRHMPNARDRPYWAQAFNAKWQDQVETIVEAGKILEVAKAELSAKEWKALLKEDLNIHRATAFKLIAIAESDTVSDVAHAQQLPVSWYTLYQLTLLDDATFAAAIADGRINPKMQRKDALALRDQKPKPKPNPKPHAIPPTDRCAMDIRSRVLTTLDELDESEWDALIAALRDELDDLATVIERRRMEKST